MAIKHEEGCACSGDCGAPIPMVLYCPTGHAHVDEGEWATQRHRTHQCQFVVAGAEFHVPAKICGLEWRPSTLATVGVKELPGAK